MGPRDRGGRMESRAMGNYGVPLRVRRQRRDPELHEYARGTVDMGIIIREGAAFGRPLPHGYDNVACVVVMYSSSPSRVFLGRRAGPGTLAACTHLPPSLPARIANEQDLIG